jgi:ferredoxin
VSDADAAHTAAGALTSQLLQSLAFALETADGALTLAAHRHREADLYRISNVCRGGGPADCGLCSLTIVHSAYGALQACVFSTSELARALRRGGPRLGCVLARATPHDVDTVVFLLPIPPIAAETLTTRLHEEKAAQGITGNARIRVCTVAGAWAANRSHG